MTDGPHRRIASAHDVQALWTALMGPDGFASRSLWIAFVDPDGWTTSELTVVDDLPVAPGDGARRFAGLLCEACADEPGATVVVLLSRPGGWAMTAWDRSWTTALSRALTPRWAPWPVHLATTDCVRPFAPDDLLAAG